MVWLHWFIHDLSFFPPSTAVRGELQPQLFVLELLQENHDRLLVHAGLPLAGHQQDAHHMLLHPPHQFCSPHGPRGCQGEPLDGAFFVLRNVQFHQNAAERNEKALIHHGSLRQSIPRWLADRKSKGPDSGRHCEAETIPSVAVLWMYVWCFPCFLVQTEKIDGAVFWPSQHFVD